MAADRFAAADVADVLAGLRFHVDLVVRDAQQLGQAVADGGLHRPEFRLLSENRQVEIDDAPAQSAQSGDRLGDETSGIGVLEGGIVVRVDIANVAETDSAEQGVGHRVQHDVGVAVAKQAARMIDAHAPQDQGAALSEPMRVVSAADAHGVLQASMEYPSPTAKFS